MQPLGNPGASSSLLFLALCSAISIVVYLEWSRKLPTNLFDVVRCYKSHRYLLLVSERKILRGVERVEDHSLNGYGSVDLFRCMSRQYISISLDHRSRRRQDQSALDSSQGRPNSGRSPKDIDCINGTAKASLTLIIDVQVHWPTESMGLLPSDQRFGTSTLPSRLLSFLICAPCEARRTRLQRADTTGISAGNLR